MKKLPFTKMHWIWNDFIVLKSMDLVENDIKLTTNLIKKICNRNKWIWSDWLLIVTKWVKTEFKYLMYNPDWSRAEMCGNGIRCFMKYLINNKLTDKKELLVETDNWILNLEVEKDLVVVNMWKPTKILNLWYENKKLWDVFIIKALDKTFKFIPISVWNPHAVIFLNNLLLEDLEIEKYGPVIEQEKNIFPKKANVEFLKIVSDKEADMRVWERGAWETLWCWTWAAAAVAAWILAWLFKSNCFIKINLKWGILEVKWSWNMKDTIILKWPAETVFEWVYKVK